MLLFGDYVLFQESSCWNRCAWIEAGRLDCAHSCFFCCMQLEEANRTLTSDVANLANEKEELNNKLKEALEGN